MKNMNRLLTTILFIFLCLNLFSQEKLEYPFTEFKFGDSPERYISNSIDLTSPEDLDEITFEYNAAVSVFGQTSKKTKLYFYNKRLLRIEMDFDYEMWDRFQTQLTSLYGEVWALDTAKIDKSGMWGPAKQFISLSQLSGAGYSSSKLTFYDDYQKDFQFSDLFQSSLFYVFAIILGSLIVYFIVGHFIIAYCSKCKKFKMKFQGVTHSNPKDYNSSLFSSSKTVYMDSTVTYKCSNCKHVRKDYRKGFWKWFNSRNK